MILKALDSEENRRQDCGRLLFPFELGRLVPFSTLHAHCLQRQNDMMDLPIIA
jgi:hypothetical protein